MNNGAVIRKLRNERKISRKVLAEGIISERTLLRFENGESKMDIDTFLLLLEGLNVQISDFQEEILSLNKTKKELVREEFRSGITDKTKRQVYLDSLKKEYDSTKDIFYLYMLIQGKTVTNKLEAQKVFDIQPTEIKLLHDYLSKIIDWGYFELAMYGNCLDLFEENFLLFNLSDVIKQFERFSYSIKHKIAYAKFLINSLLLSFERDNGESIPLLLEHLQKISESSDFTKERIYWKFFSSLYTSVYLSRNRTYSAKYYADIFYNLGYIQEAANILDLEKRLEK